MLLGLLFYSKRSTRIGAIVKQLKMRPTETGICYDYITAIARRYSVNVHQCKPCTSRLYFSTRKVPELYYIVVLFLPDSYVNITVGPA